MRPLVWEENLGSFHPVYSDVTQIRVLPVFLGPLPCSRDYPHAPYFFAVVQIIPSSSVTAILLADPGPESSAIMGINCVPVGPNT